MTGLQWLDGQIGQSVRSVTIVMLFAECTLYQCTVTMGDGREIHAIGNTLEDATDQCVSIAQNQGR